MTPESEALLSALNERTKLIVDILKHITTLSSGSIVVIGTFIDKLANTHVRPALITAICLFFLCVVIGMNTCVTLSNAYVFNIQTQRRFLGEETPEKLQEFDKAMAVALRQDTSVRFGVSTVTTAFTLAILSLGIYIVWNLK